MAVRLLSRIADGSVTGLSRRCGERPCRADWPRVHRTLARLAYPPGSRTMKQGSRRCGGDQFEAARVVLVVWLSGLFAATAFGDAPAASKGAPTYKAGPTYTKDVAPILRAKCLNCHRRHQIGPFALETYQQAKKRSK